jgi:hypothetical protein
MSQTKAQLLIGTSAQNVTVDNINTTSVNSSQTSGRKNKIINGEFLINQRVDPYVGGNGFGPDRFKVEASHDGSASFSQSTTAPDGFANSIKMDCTSIDGSIGAGQYLQLKQAIEARNLVDLAYGTSSAKTMVLSFYVRSNVTSGTYTITLFQNDNSSKLQSYQYTISSANTWERKTFTIAADTAGVINNDNGAGISVYWNLSIGSNFTGGTPRSAWTTFSSADYAAGHTINLLSNTSNEWYLTGVQLEINNSGVATDFEHRTFGEELSLCQRYYERIVERDEGSNSRENNLGIFWCDGSSFFTQIPFKIQKRAQPTLEISNFTNAFRAYGIGGGVNANTMGLNTIHRDGMLTEQAGNPGNVGFTRVFTDNSDGNKALVAALAEI